MSLSLSIHQHAGLCHSYKIMIVTHRLLYYKSCTTYVSKLCIFILSWLLILPTVTCKFLSLPETYRHIYIELEMARISRAIVELQHPQRFGWSTGIHRRAHLANNHNVAHLPAQRWRESVHLWSYSSHKRLGTWGRLLYSDLDLSLT